MGKDTTEVDRSRSSRPEVGEHRRPARAEDTSAPAAEQRHTAYDHSDESFTTCLNRQWRRSGLSLTQLARRSWLDISYVSRLVHLPCDPLNRRLGEHAETRHPSRDTVIRLGLAMQLSMEDLDELLLAAGYAPLVR